MKRKEIESHKQKSVADLEKEVRQYRERLEHLKFALAAGKVKNIREVRETKKAVARLLTFIREKQSKL